MIENDQSSDDVLVSASDLYKTFGGIKALTGASLTVHAGTIHALVGENGAGKSTALGAIAGRLSVDYGQIMIGGQDTTGITPRAARSLGVAAIYQELTIAPTLTACANVYLGQTPARRGFIARRSMRNQYQAACARVGVSIPADARGSSLSVADQQMLEIMRALESGARLILLDEPTTSLVHHERENLFRLMRELRNAGVTMVLVSHNLAEVLTISDEVTVFRNGATVATGAANQWSRGSLIAAMLGQAAPDLLASHRATEPVGQEALVRIEDLSVPGVLDGISMQANRGEIVGVAGLVGSGRTTLLRAIAGLEPTAQGSLAINGVPTHWPTSPRRAISLGFALVPEDRKGQGLLLRMSVRQNVGISNLGDFSRFGLVRRKQMRREVASVLRTYAVDPIRMEQPVGTFSGGNQQKVLLARCKMMNPTVLLADEPTRGIDVGAKAAILESLRAFANDGATVIVVSSDLEELTVLADRVVVLEGGKLVAELRAGSEAGVSSDLMLAKAFAD
jgi:ABC-type sugar transport system ATPase subunit